MRRVTLDTAPLVRRYLDGESEFSIAKSIPIARAVVRRHLLEAGVVPRNVRDASIVKASRMTPEQRKAQAKAANRAATDRVPTSEERCKNARTRQARGLFISPSEIHLRQMLLDRGIETIPQQAVGAYNIDLGAYPVAIEIFGGGWHWSGEHAARYPKRLHYLLTEGWTVLAICVSKRYGVGLGRPLDDATADYVAKFIEHEQRVHPCNIRMYRAVRGAGEILALGIVKGDTVSITQTLKSGRDASGRYVTVRSDA